MIQSIGLPPQRLVMNLLLNVIFIPVYLFLFCLTSFVALTPIFPARTARTNLQERTGARFLHAAFGTSLVLFHYFIVVIEDFIFWPLGAIMIRDNHTARIELENASQTAHEQNRGLAVLSAHFGNIEVAADSVRLLFPHQVTPSKPLIALAKPSKHPWATRLLLWYRQSRLIEVILTNRKDLVRAMLQAFKQKRAIALLVDQKPTNAGFFVPFFGQPAAFPEGGIEVALRSPCEFICISSRRLWPGVYTFEGRWLREERTAPEPLKAILETYARWLEVTIQKSKWQWCWDYNKWSRQPLNFSNQVSAHQVIE